MAGVEFGKLALVLGVLAYQLHILTMAVSRYTLVSLQSQIVNYGANEDAMLSFLIIAYLLFTIAVILMLLLNFTDLRGNKGIIVAAAVLLFLAVASVIIGVAIYDNYQSYPPSYTTTTYVTGAMSGLMAGIFILFPLCGKP